MQAATSGKLQHNSGPWQASDSGPDAARRVLSLGTTAPRAESLGNPEWTADMEYVWRNRTRSEMVRLEARAKRCRRTARDVMRMELEYGRQDIALPVMRVSALRSAEWAEERARAIALSRTDVLATCNTRWRTIGCGCNGARIELQVGCDQPQLCARCRKRHAAKWRRRITDGMRDALYDERLEWSRTPFAQRRGMRPGIYLVTLTGPHSGDMAKDRELLGVAVRKLLKHATKHGWWTTYALTWEATGDTVREHDDGVTDGQGHVHAHLAVISSWIPYTSATVVRDDPSVWCPRRRGERRARVRGLHEVWRDAMPGAIQPDVSPPRSSANDKRTQAQSAGDYLAKYVTKGVDPSEFTGAKAGELLVAFRGKRKVSTSANFWRDVDARCGCCSERYRAVGAPCSLQDIAPGAVLRSMVVRRMWLGIQEHFPPWAVRVPDRPSG